MAERVADVVAGRGHDATAVDAADSPADLAVDAVVVGASVHVGTHQPAIREFVTANRDALAAVPTAFFQVSMSSATGEGAEQAAGYVEDFLADTGWHPDRIGYFGGALRFSEYGVLKRLLMKRIAKREFPDVDPSEDAEFTDWQAVADFANDVAAFVEGRLGADAPVSGERGTVDAE